MTLPRPTPEIRSFVQAIGPDDALRLIELFGGTRLYIARQPAQWSLYATLGPDLARRLAELYGGQYLKVPVARTWRIQIYRLQGLSYAQIARKCGCSENTVAATLTTSGMTGDKSRQLDLFG